jgi:hypothetical protein
MCGILVLVEDERHNICPVSLAGPYPRRLRKMLPEELHAALIKFQRHTVCPGPESRF